MSMALVRAVNDYLFTFYASIYFLVGDEYSVIQVWQWIRQVTISWKILAVNYQGLGDHKKGSDVLNCINNKNDNIYFLQDTHFTCDEEQNIQDIFQFFPIKLF